MCLSNVLNPAGAIESFASLLQPVSPTAGKARSQTPQEIRDDARIEGYNQGYQEGFKHATEEVHRQQEALTGSLADHIAAVQGLLHRFDDEFEEALDTWSTGMAGPVAELALVVAMKIVGKAIEADPAMAVEIAKTALKEVTHAVDARVKVNPIDAPVLRQAMPQLMGSSLSLRNIEVVDDPSVLAGCLIETDGGLVDATIDTMIQRARSAMRMEAA